MGSLIYAMVSTKSDIAYMVDLISRFLANPEKQYWVIVKWIILFFFLLNGFFASYLKSIAKFVYASDKVNPC